MAGTKTSNNPFKEMTYDLRKNIYTTYFTSGCMTTSSLEDKLDLYVLLCYVTLQFKKQKPLEFTNSLKVLEHILKRTIDTSIDANGYDNMLVGLSIVCDDLLYGVEEIKRPEKFSNLSGKDLVNQIKSLLEQWTPF